MRIKRFLSLALALVMVLGSLGVVSADTSKGTGKRSSAPITGSKDETIKGKGTGSIIEVQAAAEEDISAPSDDDHKSGGCDGDHDDDHDHDHDDHEGGEKKKEQKGKGQGQGEGSGKGSKKQEGKKEGGSGGGCDGDHDH